MSLEGGDTSFAELKGATSAKALVRSTIRKNGAPLGSFDGGGTSINTTPDSGCGDKTNGSDHSGVISRGVDGSVLSWEASSLSDVEDSSKDADTDDPTLPMVGIDVGTGEDATWIDTVHVIIEGVAILLGNTWPRTQIKMRKNRRTVIPLPALAHNGCYTRRIRAAGVEARDAQTPRGGAIP